MRKLTQNNMQDHAQVSSPPRPPFLDDPRLCPSSQPSKYLPMHPPIAGGLLLVPRKPYWLQRGAMTGADEDPGLEIIRGHREGMLETYKTAMFNAAAD